MDGKLIDEIISTANKGREDRAIIMLVKYINEQDKRIEALEKKLLADKPLISTYAAHANESNLKK